MENCEIDSIVKIRDSIISKNSKIIQSEKPTDEKIFLLGEGTIILHGAIINANVKVGKNCIINSKALIEHDSIIGDNCHISTGTIINGGVKVGDGTFIGSGSITKQSITIYHKC